MHLENRGSLIWGVTIADRRILAGPLHRAPHLPLTVATPICLFAVRIGRKIQRQRFDCPPAGRVSATGCPNRRASTLIDAAFSGCGYLLLKVLPLQSASVPRGEKTCHKKLCAYTARFASAAHAPVTTMLAA